MLALCISAISADDHDKTFQEIVSDYGYPLETHEVQTTDGYVLTTFRIPHGRDQVASTDSPIVLIQHGYFDSADFVVMNGPELSLAFYLANQGFDVWVSFSNSSDLIDSFRLVMEEETSSAESTPL